MENSVFYFAKSALIGTKVKYNAYGKRMFDRGKFIHCVGEIVGATKKNPDVLKVQWEGAAKPYTIHVKFLEPVERLNSTGI